MRTLIIIFLTLLFGCSTINKKPLVEISLKDDQQISKFETQEIKIKKEKEKTTPKKRKTKTKHQEKEVDIEPIHNVKVPFEVGEKYIYNAHFKGMHAAQISFEVKDFKVINNEDVFNFKLSVQSTGVISKFYYLNMEANSFAKKQDLDSVKMELASQENNKIKKFTHLFDKNYFILLSEEDSKVSKETVSTENNPHDVLTLIYYLRTMDSVDKKSFVTVYEKDIKKVSFTKIGEEKILYKNKEINTYVYSLQIADKKEKQKMWVEASNEKRVFKFEIPISFGTIKVELE